MIIVIAVASSSPGHIPSLRGRGRVQSTYALSCTDDNEAKRMWAWAAQIRAMPMSSGKTERRRRKGGGG